MTEKTVSKYLLNLEKHFAHDNPVLLKASKVFHELDQIEFDLGLIESDETTAAKSSWWPIITLIGGNSTAKSRFINTFLGTEHLLSGIQASSYKFTVLLHNSQTNTATLPGSALDVDIRYPFYQIGRKIEQQQKSEGKRINSYLELKTLNSAAVKGKLFIDAPNMAAAPLTPVTSMLTRHVVEHSDLVLIFADVFDTSAPLVDELVATLREHQDTNKFTFLIEEPPAFMTPINRSEVISNWQRKLAGLGINSGQYIVLPNQQNNKLQDQNYLAEIEMRLANVGHDRSYRVLDALEKNIEDIEQIIIPEVGKTLVTWKERVNISSLLVLTFILSLAVFAEIQIGGILDLLLDPIVGPVSLVALLGLMVPVHLFGSRLQAKLMVAKLKERQKELELMEDLTGLFDKSQTVLRMLLPMTEPAGWNKKTKMRLHKLDEKAKSLVQALNDSFGSYDDAPTVSDFDDFKDYP
ncbi:hypothetical protein JCM14076_30730 [Methylosoma difficile]